MVRRGTASSIFATVLRIRMNKDNNNNIPPPPPRSNNHATAQHQTRWAPCKYAYRFELYHSPDVLPPLFPPFPNRFYHSGRRVPRTGVSFATTCCVQTVDRQRAAYSNYSNDGPIGLFSRAASGCANLFVVTRHAAISISPQYFARDFFCSPPPKLLRQKENLAVTVQQRRLQASLG
jgi:hypothetical protein